MAAVSRLNPIASPFLPMAHLPASCYPSPAPAAPMPGLFASQFLYPPSPHPLTPAYGWPVVACGPSAGGFTMGVPAFPPQAAYGYPLPTPTVYYYTLPPPPPPATRCRITEIFEGGGEVDAKGEARDEPSPRSVLASWSREPATSPRAPLPSRPPPTSFVGEVLPRRRPRVAFNPRGNITSLMIRNIPNKFMKKRFMTILDQHCAEENANLAGDAVKSEYDFLYVPVDFEYGCCFFPVLSFHFSYNHHCFEAKAARRLHAHLHGHCWQAAGSRKVCEVVHARLEGLDSLVAHFSGTRFPCGGQREFLPVRFEPPRDGVRKTTEHVVGRLLHRHP